MNEVILIDAGTGNLRSVQKALESLGAMLSAQMIRKKFYRAGVSSCRELAPLVILCLGCAPVDWTLRQGSGGAWHSSTWHLCWHAGVL